MTLHAEAVEAEFEREQLQQSQTQSNSYIADGPSPSLPQQGAQFLRVFVDLCPKMLILGSSVGRGIFEILRSDFEKSAERARFKSAKNPSKIEGLGDHRNRLRRP